MISLSEISTKLLLFVLINVFIVRHAHGLEWDVTSISLTSRGSGLQLSLAWSAEHPATLTLRVPGQPAGRSSSQQLVEALAAGHGRNWSGQRYVATAIGQRLRYRRHRIERAGSWQTAWLTQVDEITQLEFTSELSIHDECHGLRGATHVHNVGGHPVTLHAVTSLVFADFGWQDDASIDGMTLLRGRSDWLAEGRWVETRLRDAGLPGLTYDGRPFRTRGCIEASSVSSWSTAYELPTAVLADSRTGRRWSFQIEHNGGWLWQVGELADGLYLALLGPTDEHHQWQLELAPGATFETVSASVVLEADAGPSSVAALTGFRRASAGARTDASRAVVFNDYMNTVNGDPNAEVLHPLIDAAGDAGADYFVIDAGWYADDGDWWDSVGEWQPSTRRFPEGIDDVFNHIRERGMVPGLWLEPEVVGVNSPMADKLPDSAFLLRGGVRVTDHGRYHLDFSSDATIGFLNEVVDRLVKDHGVGYFKFDYNIRAGVGSDATVPSAGHGLLLHNRAYLAWVDSLRQRHPDLVLENCASGGMRQDFATVSRFDLQSTSDQEDFHAYAPVAAAAPMLVPPEQAANWAYPQPGMSDADVVYSLSTAVLGRLYLSGWLHRLTEVQRGLVGQAVAAHKRLLGRIPNTTPFWPLGLPGWDDQWVSFGLSGRGEDDAQELHVTIWRRSDEPGRIALTLPAPPEGQRWGEPSAVFPERSELTLIPSSDGQGLDAIDTAGVFAARVVRLKAVPN
jgi:alpha-galactosidase